MDYYFSKGACFYVDALRSFTVITEGRDEEGNYYACSIHVFIPCWTNVFVYKMAKKVVQTELEEAEYELFKRTVEKRGMSIKKGLREAVHQWVTTQIPVSEDSLFKIEPVKTGIETDSSNLDKTLYRG
jgi:hypothetical protein